MDKHWAVIDNRNLKKIESHWRAHRDSKFKQSIDSMSIDELRRLALKQDTKIQAKQAEIDLLSHIASCAHWYLSEPKLAKKDLIQALIKSGFWMPRIKRFKDKTPYSFKVESYYYLVSAVNGIGETRTYGILIERDDYISFSAWIDGRIPIRFWNVYQISALVPPSPSNGKLIMKIPFVQPDNGIFKFKLFGPAYTGESHFFSAKPFHQKGK